MKSIKNQISRINFNLYIPLILIFLFVINCKPTNDSYQFKEGNATIKGKIIDYDGIYKSGLLSYFDAIGRIVENKVFSIDSIGRFEVSFQIPHPIYNAAYFMIEGNYYNIFLEPEKDLEISFSDTKIQFHGENGRANTQLMHIENTLYEAFKEEIEHAKFLHQKNISYEDYLQIQIELAKKRLDFISKYSKDNDISPVAYDAILQNTYYAPAKSWICFRYDYSQRSPSKRDTLFENFYEDLFDNYPINDKNALISREYIDYISNIKTVLAMESEGESLISYIQASGKFTPDELLLIKGVFNKDSTIITSREYKLFNTTENKRKRSELIQKCYMNNVLNLVSQIPKGIGRDLIISQGVSEYYFGNIYVSPSKEEWHKISSLVQTEFVYNYLLDHDNTIKMSISETETNQVPTEIIESANNLTKEIFSKYVGKVVYVDFWATWCGPCRIEIPYSKTLIEQFKDEDVVFVFLCCKSQKKDWENTIAHENLKGEHYFIKDKDFIELSTLFGVEGFPTYILINKEGELVMKHAPRPSSMSSIMAEIKKLLVNI